MVHNSFPLQQHHFLFNLLGCLVVHYFRRTGGIIQAPGLRFVIALYTVFCVTPNILTV